MQFSLMPVIVMELRGVMVFDAGEELVEQLEELRGAFVGEAGQVKGQDERFAFH